MACTTEASLSPLMPCTEWAFQASHELAELALPDRERPAAVGLRGASLRELVEGTLGVDRVPAEERDVDRSSRHKDERVHRGRMKHGVDLRGRSAVGASDHVELPVPERRPHRIQVIHRHPRPVLRHVGVVPFRSPVPLVDEQDVVIRIEQRQLLARSAALSVAALPGPPAR